MTVNDLLKRLNKIEDKDKMVLITCGDGWSNIDKIIETKCFINLDIEMFPVFSGN